MQCLHFLIVAISHTASQFFLQYFTLVFLQNVTDKSVYILMVKIPLSLQVPNGWKVSLADNPGFDERNKRISENAVRSLKASSAYLYITTYDQYRQAQSVDFIKAMYEDNKG